MDKTTKKHISTLNREMGEVKTDMSWMRKEIVDVKDSIKNTNKLVLIGILVPIALFLIQKVMGV